MASFFPSARKLKKAISLLEEGKGREAFRIFAALANKGLVDAQFRVGQCYLGGVGVPLSLEEGARWMYRAAEAGQADACFSLGTLYITGLPEGFDPARIPSSGMAVSASDASRKTDPEKALFWACKGGNAGNADAQALVGYLLTHGPEELRDLPQARRWYERAAIGESAQGYYGLGLILLNEAKTQEERVQAARYFHKAVNMGVRTACTILAWMYEKGFGVESDIRKSAEFYLKAAEAGIASAQARYGLMLLKGVGVEVNVTRAESWLRRAAYGGDADAAAMLGDLYIRGDVLLHNSVEALKWYHIAANYGHVPAARAIAVMYFSGTGTQRDLEKAAYWFNLAAEKGDRSSGADLGNLILSGEVQAEEEQVALQARFQVLAEQGDQLSAFNLGVCLAKGIGGPQDEKKALHWLYQALDGIVNAQYWYGRLLFEAGGRLGDPVEGFEWIEKAAEAGMAEACATLAQIFVTGQIGILPDHMRALELYKQAANQGNVDAMFSLGAMYGGGHDVPEDRMKAQDYFELAARQGHPLAQMMLGRYLVKGLAGRFDYDEGRQWLEHAASQGVEAAKDNLRMLNQSVEMAR